MKLSDLSMVNQELRDSQANLKQQIGESINQFRPENTMVNQGIQDSQAGIANQIADATMMFKPENTLSNIGLMDSRNYLNQQISNATSPFMNQNLMASNYPFMEQQVKPSVSVINPEKQRRLDQIYAGVGEDIWRR